MGRDVFPARVAPRPAPLKGGAARRRGDGVARGARRDVGTGGEEGGGLGWVL